MSNRDVSLVLDAICDRCGHRGAYDLMGDYLCPRCASGGEPTSLEKEARLTDEECSEIWHRGNGTVREGNRAIANAASAKALRVCEARIEQLEAEVESWQATAEELGSKNVNETLIARHEMREGLLEARIRELEKTLRRERGEQ